MFVRPRMYGRCCLRALSVFVLLAFLVGCGGSVAEDPTNQQNQENQHNQENQDERFFVGGTVTGLQAAGLVLDNNGDRLSVDEDGSFQFAESLEDGAAYEVTVVETPDDHACIVGAATGVIDGADVNDVEVICTIDTGSDGAFLQITIDEAASTLDVEEGETVIVSVRIDNTGNEFGNKQVSFSIDGMVQESQTVMIGEGAYRTITFEWETAAGDAGEYTAEVSSPDSSDSVAVTVQERDLSPRFMVEIDEAASTLEVVAGEDVVVVVDVENRGEEAGVRDIDLEIDGAVVATSQALELAGGAQQTITLTWTTTESDIGAFSAVVTSGDDSFSADGAVLAPPPLPAHLEVSIDTAASTLDVVEGEVIEVVATVENTGEVTGTQNIALHVDGVLRDTEANLEVSAGASQTVTLQWQTGPGDAGPFVLSVESDDTTDTASGVVWAPAYFAVTIDSDASTLSVEEEETLVVVVDIQNTGDLTATRDVTLTIGGVVRDTATGVELAAGASQSITLQWATVQGNAGFYTAYVSSGDDTSSVSVSVADYSAPAPAHFDVSIDVNASTLTVDEGDTVIVVASVTNLGEEADTQDLVLEIDGVVRDTASNVELAGGATQVVTLEWPTAFGEAGVYTAAVSSDNTTVNTTVTVVGTQATLSGNVLDAMGVVDMAGVELSLLEVGTDNVLDTIVLGAGGAYAFDDLSVGAYDLRLQAPGLEPNYQVDEFGGDTIVTVSLAAGANQQNLTIDWVRTTHLMIDGGLFDFQYNDPDGSLVVMLPGCEEQADASWEPQPVDPDSDDIDISYDPDNECFQINNIGIDLHTGQLTVSTDNLLFPNVTIFIDDSDNNIDSMVNWVEVDFEWIFDSISGQVDFTTGELTVNLELRILVGGTVSTSIGNYNFGARADRNDCQLTGAWGGDITNPQLDTNGEQIGQYLHDPISMTLTTGSSGAVAGSPYHPGERFFLAVDNVMTIDRLSEGQYGSNDPGGASCGQLNVFFGAVQEDFAQIFNGLLDLPAGTGEVFGEFNLVVP